MTAHQQQQRDFHWGPCQITDQNTETSLCYPADVPAGLYSLPCTFVDLRVLKCKVFESIDQVGNKNQNNFISGILKKRLVSKHSNISFS